MSKFETEKLREALIDLERSRQKEEFEKKIAECLVTGLRLIASASDREEMFHSLINHINTLIPFKYSFLLREVNVINDKEVELQSVFPMMEGITKIENKLALYNSQTPLYVFNVEGWDTYIFKEITNEECSNGSLLILPLLTKSAKYWFFMLSPIRSGFGRQHITIASKVSELLKQAIDKDEYIVKLLQSNKMRALGEMAGGIAHEINNPLTIIKGSLKSLSRLLTPDEFSKVDHVLERVEKNVDRMSKIIQSLRVVSRGDVTKDHTTPVTINEVLDDTLGCCQEKFRYSNVDLSVEIDPEIKDIQYNMNRILLSQVFLNLLNNSFDAIKTLKTRWIKITVRKEDQKIHFYFIDSGEGLPKEIQNKIFQPFFSTKEIGEGAGLGLGICKSILASLKGSIYIDSNFSNTCFHIVLPIERSSN